MLILNHIGPLFGLTYLTNMCIIPHIWKLSNIITIPNKDINTGNHIQVHFTSPNNCQNLVKQCEIRKEVKNTTEEETRKIRIMILNPKIKEGKSDVE